MGILRSKCLEIFFLQHQNEKKATNFTFHNRQKRNNFTKHIIAYKWLDAWGLLVVKYGHKLYLLFVESSIKDFFNKCDQIREKNFKNYSTWLHLYFCCHYFFIIITILLWKPCWQAGGEFLTLRICISVVDLW